MCSCSVNYTRVVKSTNSIFRWSCDWRRIPSRGKIAAQRRAFDAIPMRLSGEFVGIGSSPRPVRPHEGDAISREFSGCALPAKRAIWHTRVCGRHYHGDSGKESTINVLIDGGPELSVTAQVRKPEEGINTDAKDNCNGCKGPECAFRSHGSDLHKQRAS